MLANLGPFGLEGTRQLAIAASRLVARICPELGPTGNETSGMYNSYCTSALTSEASTSPQSHAPDPTCGSTFVPLNALWAWGKKRSPHI